MIDISTLIPGDKVKVVDEWPPDGRQNPDGDMDKYLGKILTVKDTVVKEDALSSCCRVCEDTDNFLGHGWYWFPEMLEEVESKDFEPADINELMSFLGI